MSDENSIDCGLSLGEQEFKKLKIKDQMSVLYKNQCATLDLLRNYRLHQRVQYVVMGAIGTALVWLIKIQLGV